jgi:hypothetical protein
VGSPESRSKSVLKTVLQFFQTLASKRLVPLDDLTLLFDCPLSLFSTFCDTPSETLQEELLAKVEGVSDWDSEHSIFSFLNDHPDLLASFVRDPKKHIFKGLLLYLLCHFFQKRGKLYQFHEKKSLVSCDLGLDHGELVRFGVIILNGGFQFCPLRKVPK